MVTVKLIFCLFIVLLLACNERKNQNSEYDIPDKGFLFQEVLNQEDSTFPFYPVRNVLSNFDSTRDAFYTRKLLEVFDEPNISLRPSKIPTFRFVYFPWTNLACIITITPTSITAKVGDRVPYMHFEERNLSEKEQIHFNLFRYGFPVSKRITRGSSKRRGGLDSLVNIYPELNNQEYYHSLLNKAFIALDTPFTYTSTTIRLQEDDFLGIVQKLKSADFWNLKVEEPCVDIATDGARYFLEFSTWNRYVFMSFLSGCDNDRLFTLRLALREILKQFELNEKFRV